ncbi:hypothetical protein Ahy_B03g066249 [Arachis hypogaea]|uniref:Aminotransferase-like plant mobile domain-containing protein n=1 Tax=Arachis hypogaea TaxID=3818 RepID=A0A445A3L3_ARAHY|nr:hypothetical protein Ahy_B03g066249 [Arachis hypogaea]
MIFTFREISLGQRCTGSFCRCSVTSPGSYNLVGDWLVHLYRALCRTSRVDCKEIDGPLTLLLTWAWIRLPFLTSIPGYSQLFLIANSVARCILNLINELSNVRWHNWECADWPYRFHSLAHFRRALDDLQERQAYAIGHIEPDVILFDIRQHSVIWSATVPLISFECVEWHPSNRLRRQFGLIQGVPHQERDLGEAHDKVLTRPKNQDWSGTHLFWVMHWTNPYSHVLIEHLVPSQYPLKIYIHWYRDTYGAHLHLSDLVLQENQEGNPVHNQENQQDQSPPPPQTQAQQEPEHFTPYIPDTQSVNYFTPSVHYINNIGVSCNKNQGIMVLLANCLDSWLLCQVTHIQVITKTFPLTRGCTRVVFLQSGLFVDSSRSDDATGEIIQSGNPCRILMGDQKAVDDEADNYLVDHPDEDRMRMTMRMRMRMMMITTA